MVDLLEVTPGRVSPLPNLKLDDARMHANGLLGSELFRCFGLYEELPDQEPRDKGWRDPRKLELIAAIGNVSSMPTDGDYGVRVADEHRRILGCDVVKGKPWPAKGTTYERPIAAGVDNQAKRRVLAGKSFAYIPLDGTIEIGLSPERSEEVKPGEVFLSESGAAHTVHIPSGLITVELVVGGDETASWHDEWNRYVKAQPNPNF